MAKFSMNSDAIDKQIDELPQADIDDLLDASYKERRCKLELAFLSAGLFLLVCLAILHVSFYIGDNHPPMLHRIYLLAMTVGVTPYAMVQFYKNAHASAVIRATRRIHTRNIGTTRGA